MRNFTNLHVLLQKHRTISCIKQIIQFGVHKSWLFFDQLSDYKLLKDSTPSG